ncbi:MAG: hypothetical protein NWQ32_11525, partial [Paracoccaceae bacterium]|nr:hypothetical protein [Paracoccaceae bacterium]
MAKDKSQTDDYLAPLKRLLLGVLVLCLIGLFLLWRIDSPRVERFRAAVVDRVVPSFDWAMAPVTATVPAGPAAARSTTGPRRSGR